MKFSPAFATSPVPSVMAAAPKVASDNFFMKVEVPMILISPN
jgi:hypothetical protein